jgi:TonB family protein
MLRVITPLLFGAMQLMQPAAAATTKPIVQFDDCALPEWPLPSLRAEHTGTVTLAFLIGKDGRVLETRIKKSSGHPELDLAAQEGIERCSFTPGTENGAPVTAWMDMQYVWRLEGDAPVMPAKNLMQLLMAADAGDAASQLQLSEAYMFGRGVQQDPEQARHWVAKAAEQGYPDAQSAMGMLAMAEADTPNPEAAMVWFRKAAAQGNAPGMFMVAMHLLDTEKFDEGEALLMQASDKNFPIAQAMLGTILVDREDAVEQLHGIALLERAATKNISEAIYKLAECYATGRVVDRNDAKAAKLYSRAAANGSPDAKLALARMYQDGVGVIRNPERAKRLMQEAEEPDAAEESP